MTLAFRVMAAGAVFSVFISGCGAPPTPQAQPPVAPVQQVVQSPTPTAPPAAPAGSAGETESTDVPKPAVADADRLARQAEEHAKAIEVLLAARARDDVQGRGVKVIEPVPRNAETPVAPPAGANRTTPPASPTVAPSVPPSTPSVAERTRLDPSGPSTPTVPESQGANTAVSVGAPTPPDTLKTPASPAPRAEATATGKTEDSLEQHLGKRARDYPRDLASQLDYQLALFLKDEQVPRAADVANLPVEDREVITALLDGLANFRGAIRADNNLLMTRKIRPLVDMSERLRSRADLNIPNATLCRDVKGFGAYTAIEPLRFEAGIAHKAIVYAEVENFSSQLNEKNLWDTRLKQELTIYDQNGFSVWTDKIDISDTCRNRRRDFFVVRVIQLSPKLNLGRYVLKVSVTDTQSNRIAETSIPIMIFAN